MAVIYYNKSDELPRIEDQSLKLLYACKSSCEQTAAIPTAFHAHDSHLEIQYISEGSAKIYINNKMYKARKGDIVVYNAGALHDESIDDEQGMWFYNFGVKDFKIMGLPENHLIPFDTIPVIHTGNMSDTIQAIFHEIYDQISKDKPSASTICHHLLCALFVIIIDQIPHSKFSRIDDEEYSFQQSKKYIDEHFTENISIEMLSSISHMSVSGFAHQFKKFLGMAPLQYIIRRRIGLAQRLLVRTDKSITDISMEIGYDNVSHFNNQFKRFVGTSPQNYRKLWVGNEQFKNLNHIYNNLMKT